MGISAIASFKAVHASGYTLFALIRWDFAGACGATGLGVEMPYI